MLTDYVVDTHALWRLRHSVAGVYLDDFTDWLADRGYTQGTIRSYVFAAVRFLTWAHAAGKKVSTLTPSTLARYRDYLIATNPTGKRSHQRANAHCGAQRFVVFLRQHGLAPDLCPAEPPLLAAFRAWMRQHRGVTEVTLNSYSCMLRRLLQALGSEPARYSAAQLRAFVLAQSQGYSHSHAERVVTVVRMFVRFLIATERCTSSLQGAIPPLARWRQATLPRYLEPEVVERIISGCDPSTPMGARDRAVVLLLARLALRAGDVVGLRLHDIDWQNGRLLVSGKTRQATLLPLPQDVGDAILHYLETGRPAVAGDELFLISHAPYTPLPAQQVCKTAARAIRRVGIEAPSYGAHIFRHSAATTLLRQGLSLQAIGTVLRHRNVDTTALYAKVDVDLLQRIALPWPEEDTPC